MYLALIFAALIGQFCQAKQSICDRIFSQWEKRHYETAIFLSNKHGKSSLARVIRFDELLQGHHDKFYCACALDFLRKNPDWPLKEELLKKGDSLILRWSDSELIAWCKVNPPRVATAYKKYAIAMAKKHGTVSFVIPLLRNGWIFGDFNRHQEKEYLRKYGKYIGYAEHKARAANLLMFGNKEGALRQSQHLPIPEREIVLASIEILDCSDPSRLFTKFYRTKRLSHELVYLFAQKLFGLDHISKKDLDLVAQALTSLGKEKSHLEKWALTRRRLARELLAHKSYKAAYKVIKDVGGGSVQEHFLAGWIALTFLEDPKAALSQFFKMKANCTVASSMSKSYYWIARSLFALKRHEEGRAYTAKAASDCSSFYGQIAMENLKRYQFPRGAITSEAPRARMQELEAISLLNQHGKSEIASKLCRSLFARLSKPQIAYALEYLKREELLFESLSWNCKIGSFAANHGVINSTLLLPRIELDQPSVLEDSLLHAIVKRESCFDPNALSRCGAFGLMQLMMPTAVETARKNGLSLKKGGLDPQENLRLGSLYMAELLERYSGSYVLALAAYNAGPVKVDDWVKCYGKPKAGNVRSVVQWIENLPFAETREYIQAVLAFRSLYEASLNKNKKVLISSALK